MDALSTRVEHLAKHSEQLDAELKRSQGALDQTQACMLALRGGMKSALAGLRFTKSDDTFGGGFPFYASRCQGVLSDKQVKSLKGEFHSAQLLVARVADQRFGDLLPDPGVVVGTTSVTAVCNDGTNSYSQHASGTCSYHGGVDRWVKYPGN